MYLIYKIRRIDSEMKELAVKAGGMPVYSVCLAYEGGKMIIGGIDDTIHDLPPINIPFNSLITDLISNSLG